VVKINHKASKLPDLDEFLGPSASTQASATPSTSPSVATDSEHSPASTTASIATNDGESSKSSDGDEMPSMADQDIVNPFTGEITQVDDIDGLITLYEGLDRVNKQAYAVMVRVRELLAAKTEGEARTRRIYGERRKAKLEFPSESFTQSELKTLWEEYPDLRDEALKIDAIGVKLREYKKLVNASGGERLNAFRDALSRACRGCVGTPTLKIEE
jgi:hypothetical protein